MSSNVLSCEIIHLCIIKLYLNQMGGVRGGGRGWKEGRKEKGETNSQVARPCIWRRWAQCQRTLPQPPPAASAVNSTVRLLPKAIKPNHAVPPSMKNRKADGHTGSLLHIPFKLPIFLFPPHRPPSSPRPSAPFLFPLLPSPTSSWNFIFKSGEKT